MAAQAGFACLVRKSGTSTGIVTEPVSITGSGSLQFRITASSRRVIDPNVDFHFKNGTTTIAYSSIQALNFLTGEVTFTAAQADGSVTSLSFTGNYLPITTSEDVLLGATSFKLNLTQDLLGVDVFTGSTTDYYRKRMVALQDASLDVQTIADPDDLADLATAQFNGTPVVAEIFFGDETQHRFRGICLVETIDTSSAVEGRVETSLGFKISAVKNATANQIASYTFTVFPG